MSKIELVFTDEEIDRFAEKIVNKLNKPNNHSEDCDHDWCNCGMVSGIKTRYQIYVCYKCGTECVHRTSLVSGKTTIWNT